MFIAGISKLAVISPTNNTKTNMNIGDCYILSSAFHKIDVGLIYIGETKSDFYFTPLNFTNHKFDNTLNCIYQGKIQTNTVYHGIDFIEKMGLFAIDESKSKPSFLTNYCKENKPFITLDLNASKIVIGQKSTSDDQIIIGGGTNFPPKKELFDKFDIQSITTISKRTPSDLNLILNSN